MFTTTTYHDTEQYVESVTNTVIQAGTNTSSLHHYNVCYRFHIPVQYYNVTNSHPLLNGFSTQ